MTKAGEVTFIASNAPEEQFEQLRTALTVLHPQKGDIWVVDATQVDVDALSHFQMPEITWPIPIIVACPRGEATIEQAIRTVDLSTLKRIVAEMEAESST